MATTRPQSGTRTSRARVSDRDEYPAIGVAVSIVPRSGIVMGPPPRVRLRPGAAGVRAPSPSVPVLPTVALKVPEVVLPQIVEPVVEVAQRGEDEVDTGVVILREQHTTIHQGDLPVDLEGGHVATDVPEPSERDHPQRSWGQFGG